jgi:hypothetical protein
VNRRGFLRRGLLGGALLAVGGSAGLVVWPTRRTHAPKRALEVLDEREFAILAAIAARTVVAPGADPVEIAHGVDLKLTYQAPESQKEFKQLLGLFDNAFAGLAFDARVRPFTHLSPEAQDAALESWRRSRLLVRRSGYQALRKLTQMAHYENPSVWGQLGYPGPPTIAQPT